MDENYEKEEKLDRLKQLKENLAQEKKESLLSSFSNSSSNLDLSSIIKQKSAKKLNISKNNAINKITNKQKNKSSSDLNNNNNVFENNQINGENIIYENEFAEEDNIDVSLFDEIKPAMNFNYSLDDFQKRSIIRLEQNNNILVCAHTSCGKTLVAEYGIALAKNNRKKVIYTSPIKSLSNQKYSELEKKFENVGIITGDVKKNQDAQCLVVTTEILHKFLYNQCDIMNNVGTVIFDEVHYINDNERGHIWEEILIVLPKNISIIMLSATIPNYYEFASWIGNIKKTKVYIEITKKRVIPLQYSIYIDEHHIFQIKNKKEKIDYKEIENAFVYLKSKKKKNNYNNKIGMSENKNNRDSEKENKIRGESSSSNSEKEGNEGNEINADENNNEEETNETSDNNSNHNEKNNYKKNEEEDKVKEVIKYLLNKKLYPATLFIFHIQKIQEYSNMVIKNNNLSELPKEVMEKIDNFFDKAISEIPEESKNIGQIKYIKQILKYGIGVHHSGLLPILREIIEILYFHGFIKILFATTSFSIGLNMPTKTVVFTSLYKYHENKNKMITSSEFLQMCGRAGRRGIDEIGNVFILYYKNKGKKEIESLKNILEGKGNELGSKFRLSYRIILSFYHQNLKDIKDFFRESFYESHNIKINPEKLEKIKKLKKEIEKKINFIYPKNVKKKDTISKKQLYDLEDLPFKKILNKISNYDSINNKIYNNKKIIEYLENKHGIILLVKNNSYNGINKYNKPDLVMLINVLNLKGKKKLWCLTITNFDNKCCSNSNKIEESKKNEIEIVAPKFNNNKGKFKEYQYKYLLLNVEDIIEIYEKPKIYLDEYYNKDKISNNFDITDEGYYYFKNDKSIHNALKFFYRIIKNNFPKKDILINSKHIKIHQNKKIVKELDYQKLINIENKNNEDFLKKNKLKEEIENIQNSLHQKNINIINDILSIEIKIKKIRKEIINGEKQELDKKFNQRLKLLESLNYIQIDNNGDSNTFNNIEEVNYYNYSLTLKGKASLEILANDSILITELLFSNIFTINNKILPVEIIVPFLASFVNCERVKDLDTEIELHDDKTNNENIQYLMGNFYKIYNNLNETEKIFELSESCYNRYFSFKYFYPIYFWMKGDKLSDVCKKYQILEGKFYTIIINVFYIVVEIINFYNKINVKQEIIETFTNIKNNLLKDILKVESLYLKNIDIDDI